LNLEAQLRNFRRRTEITIPQVDVALATSAATGFFARQPHLNSQYVDGGLFDDLDKLYVPRFELSGQRPCEGYRIPDALVWVAGGKDERIL